MRLPNVGHGQLGADYTIAIAPFRHLVVYPPMIRQIGRAWRTRSAGADPASPRA